MHRNRNYLSEFSNIQFSGKPLREDIFSEPTVLVPHKYKNDENSISEYIKQEYFRLMNYNQFYGIPGEEKTIDNFNVVYIDDDSTIKVNAENGFSDMVNPIIIVDTGNFAGLYYLDSLNTTLLNIIGLITDISEGTIIIDSHQNLSMNSKNAMILRRYTIGYLFQNYGLIEDESVLWNLKLALEYKKIKKEEKLKLINKYLKQFELNDMLNKKVYQLSGGEQQRIAIIKLILQGSQVILADEPTSGLDKENELIVMKLLKELNEKGITIIMVTHNMNLCDCFSRVINVENFR